MKLSVIIPCYNASDTISDQMEALAEQVWSEPWEVIVVDNKSTDNSMAIVEQYKESIPNLKIIKASEQQGQPYALNTGIKAAIGDSVAFCDADDVIGNGWVRAMGEALFRHDFVACRMDTEKLNSKWIRNDRGNSQETGLPQIWYPPYLPHAGGGTLGIKRALCKKVGDFDDTLPCLHDTDYCFRIQLLGTKLHFVSEAVTYVRFRESLHDLYCQARNYAKYNVLVSKRYASLGGGRRVNAFSLWKRYALKWIRQIRYIPHVFYKNKRGKWFWSLGWQIGRLQGSLKHKAPPV